EYLPDHYALNDFRWEPPERARDRGEIGFGDLLDNLIVADAAVAPAFAAPLFAVPRLWAEPEVEERLDSHSYHESHASCSICALPFKNGAPEGERTAQVLSCSHLVCKSCVAQFKKHHHFNDMDHSFLPQLLPCPVCRTNVQWTNLPECKEIGYLYCQLELINTENEQQLEGLAQARASTRKRLYKHRSSLTSLTQEISTKMRRLTTKADAVSGQILDHSTFAVHQAAIKSIKNVKQGEWIKQEADEEVVHIENRVEEIRGLYAKIEEHLDALLEDIPLTPLELPSMDEDEESGDEDEGEEEQENDIEEESEEDGDAVAKEEDEENIELEEEVEEEEDDEEEEEEEAEVEAQQMAVPREAVGMLIALCLLEKIRSCKK
ncbi:hypothetical protein PFISCL1PPCAC_7673, partial [Pristionchus fissidentatus]